MRRSLVAAVGIVSVVATAVVGWRWWTAPPRANAAILAAAIEVAPVNADGAIALAQPARWTRWLVSHPQAMAVLTIAAPSADRALPRLRGFLAALARAARGPITVWWSGGNLAAGATVGRGAARALQELAALQGFALRTQPQSGGVLVIGATTGTLLGPRGAAPHLAGLGALAALGRVGTRWWQARTTRSALELVSGQPPELPGPTATDTVATADLAALVGPATGVAWVPHAPACVLFDSGGWAAALPATVLSPQVVRVLSLGGEKPPATPGGAYRWRGVLGDLWVRPGHGVAVASRPDLLEELPSGPITGESGAVKGPDLAVLCTRVARACEGIPGGEGLAAGLRRAGPLLEGLALARWRLLRDGGHIVLEW